MSYRNIKAITYETNCTSISLGKWKQLTKNSVQANIREVNKLVRLHCPSIYKDLSLTLYNPYTYSRTKTHLILRHSSIEYFFKIVY